MSDSAELRRDTRKKISDLVTVGNVISEQPIGHIGNLSRSGMLLICNQQLNDNAIYQLRFSLPDPVKGGHLSFELGVHEQWTQSSADAGRYWSGVRIIDISPQAETQLLEWIG